VESGAFTAEHQNTVGAEVEVGVIRRASFVEAQNPNIRFLHLLEGADEVGDSGDADVLGGAGGGLGHSSRDRGGAAFGQEDAVDACTICGAEQGPEIVGIFDAIECEEKSVLSTRLGWRREEIFESQKAALADNGESTLVGVGASHPRELFAGFQGDPHAGVSAQPRQTLEFGVAAFPGKYDPFQPSRTRPDRLFHWVEPVKYIHRPSLLGEKTAQSGGIDPTMINIRSSSLRRSRE
jgi:hypothetical protein